MFYGTHRTGLAYRKAIHRTTQTERTRINIQAPSGIRKHDTKVREVEDIMRLRPHGHCDWRLKFCTKKHILHDLCAKSPKQNSSSVRINNVANTL